jgi:L-threonylcarbamoyladenylate synthase
VDAVIADPLLEDRVARAAEVLRAGGVLAYPTETFYGLGALASNRAAVARLVAAKLRPDGKPLPLIAADLSQVAQVVARLEPAAQRIADALWPGPLTLVLPAAAGLAPEISAGTGTIAVRVPGSEIARRLARLAGGAIVSTSANVSGEPPPAAPRDLARPLLARIDGVLDAGPTPGGLASTIVVLEHGEPRLLREGPISLERVLAVSR